MDAASATEIQHRFNELRSELLEGREKTVDWWLIATAIFLALLGVAAVFGGYLTFRRFREIEVEACENAAVSKKHAEEARNLVEEIKTKRDEAESLVLLQQAGKIDEAIEKWRALANIVEGTDNKAEAQA